LKAIAGKRSNPSLQAPPQKNQQQTKILQF